MDEQIKQIAERVRGLRDALGLGIDEMAEAADWLLHNMLPLSRENVTCQSVPCKR